MINLKNEKGSITLFVLVSCLFFVASVVCIQMYMQSKLTAVDREYKQVKANYEKDFDTLDETYNNLAQEDDLKVEFKDISIDKQAKKISATISTYLYSIKTMKYGWFYNENAIAIADLNSQNITDWTYVESVEGTNNIIASRTYTEEKKDGFYYLCFMVNNKEFWMKDPITTGYINDGLILHLDAINNLGLGDSNHSTTTTTWKDLSGNGNDGTVYDAKWNEKSINLNSTNSGITGNCTDSLKITDFTIEILLESYTENSNGALLYDFHNSGPDGYFAKIYNDYIGLSFGNTRDNISYDFVNSSYPLKIDVMCDKTNRKWSLYINGEIIKNYTGNINIEETTSSKFGILNDSGRKEGAYFGKLSNFKIYNYALTEDEIRQNYLMDKIRFNIEE